MTKPKASAATPDEAPPDEAAIFKAYSELRSGLSAWGDTVLGQFKHPALLRHVHSLRSRMKSEASLSIRIKERFTEGIRVTPDNLTQKIQDLAGVRVLHIRKRDLEPINEFITKHTIWKLIDGPTAYNWDPRFVPLLERLNIKIKPSKNLYTSLHYTVADIHDGKWLCEIQVRTLFEEIWGEVSHEPYDHPEKYEAYQRHLDALNRLCTLGTGIVEDLDYFVAVEKELRAKEAELGKTKEQVKELQAALERAEKTAAKKGETAVVQDLAQASGIVRELSESIPRLVTHPEMLSPGASGRLISGKHDYITVDPRAERLMRGEILAFPGDTPLANSIVELNSMARDFTGANPYSDSIAQAGVIARDQVGLNPYVRALSENGGVMNPPPTGPIQAAFMQKETCAICSQFIDPMMGVGRAKCPACSAPIHVTHLTLLNDGGTCQKCGRTF